MSGEQKGKAKVGKVLAGIFAAIGLYVVLGIIFQLIFRVSMSENECLVRALSSFPAPEHEHVAELTYKSCGETTAISEVTLRRTSNKSEAAVLLLVKRHVDERSVVPYPPGISLSWGSPTQLAIAVPREDMPAQKSEETYGVFVKYVPSP